MIFMNSYCGLRPRELTRIVPACLSPCRTLNPSIIPQAPNQDMISSPKKDILSHYESVNQISAFRPMSTIHELQAEPSKVTYDLSILSRPVRFQRLVTDWRTTWWKRALHAAIRACPAPWRSAHVSLRVTGMDSQDTRAPGTRMRSSRSSQEFFFLVF